MAPADVEAAAASLAQAFLDDPHFSWIVRNEAIRLERLRAAFALFIRRLWLPQDASFVHQRLVGAAVWMPPGTAHVDVWTQLRMTPATIGVLRGDSLRLLRALNFIERRHPRTPDHWYLPLIGVAPAWQGRGFGAALMRPVLERCDRDRTPAYLEASTPRNRALYERHGFEVVEECAYAGDGPPMWRMWREPRAGAPQP